MQRHTLVLAVALALAPAAALAQHNHNHGAPAAAPAASKASTLSEGEVRKVDRTARTITLRHGPIENLDMPPMTMPFVVSDAKMLDQVKVGDKVRFVAAMKGDQLIVTRIEK